MASNREYFGHVSFLLRLKFSIFSEIMNDVIRATVKDHNKKPGGMEWRVLVVDDQSMRMVSACTKMHELSAEGITSNNLSMKVFTVQCVGHITTRKAFSSH